MAHTKQGTHIPRARPQSAHRFWFDRNVGKWCVSAITGGAPGAVLMVDDLQLCEVDVKAHPDGTMTCEAELLADGKTFRPTQLGGATARRATLRLCRSYDTVLHVPLVAAGGMGTQ